MRDEAVDPAFVIEEIYRRIPKIACKGLCHESCGPVPASRFEITAMERTTIVPFGADQKTGTCNMLFAGRCSVYDNRPLLCRLWGVTRKMPCIFGCVPERVMSNTESRDLLELVGKVGGGYDLDRLGIFGMFG